MGYKGENPRRVGRRMQEVLGEGRKLADPKDEYIPEADNTGVPKNFVIRCPRCRWARVSSGVAADLEDLHEVDRDCVNCGKFRLFKCPKCGGRASMKRIKGNT